MTFNELFQLSKPMTFDEVPYGRYFLYKIDNSSNKYVCMRKQEICYCDDFSDEIKEDSAVWFIKEENHGIIVYKKELTDVCYLVCTNDLYQYVKERRIKYIPIKRLYVPDANIFCDIEEQEKALEELQQFVSCSSTLILEDKSYNDVENVLNKIEVQKKSIECLKRAERRREEYSKNEQTIFMKVLEMIKSL